MKSKEEINSYCKALLVLQIILPIIVFTYVIGAWNIPVDIVAVIVGLDCFMAVLSLVFVCKASGGEAVQARGQEDAGENSPGGEKRKDSGGGNGASRDSKKGTDEGGKGKSKASEGSSYQREEGCTRDGGQTSRKKDRRGKRKRRTVGGKQFEAQRRQAAGSSGGAQEDSRKGQRGEGLDGTAAAARKPEGEVYQYKGSGGAGTKFYAKEAEMDESWPHKVLIVDDSLTTLKLLSAFLRKMNIGSSMARSGAEAIEAVQRERFSLIIIDHMMKGRDGLDTVKAIRQLNDEYYQKVPVVDVLSMGMEQYEVQLNEEYYQAYLTKPIEYELLQQVMLTYGLYTEE